MGWWWNSSSPQKDKLQQQQQQNNDNNALPPPVSRALSPDEQAEAAFKQFLAGLEEEEKNKPSSKSSPAAASSSESAQATTTEQHPNGPPSSIAPESLYSDTMSCRTAFDYAFFCQSFGGQFVNVYRYGELRSCSEHWDNFWMCMKTRAYPEEERKKIIRDHNRKTAIKYKTGPSSEDVWDLRTEPVRDAFGGDFAAFERMKAEEEGKESPSL